MEHSSSNIGSILVATDSLQTIIQANNRIDCKCYVFSPFASYHSILFHSPNSGGCYKLVNLLKPAETQMKWKLVCP